MKITSYMLRYILFVALDIESVGQILSYFWSAWEAISAREQQYNILKWCTPINQISSFLNFEDNHNQHTASNKHSTWQSLSKPSPSPSPSIHMWIMIIFQKWNSHPKGSTRMKNVIFLSSLFARFENRDDSRLKSYKCLEVRTIVTKQCVWHGAGCTKSISVDGISDNDWWINKY